MTALAAPAAWTIDAACGEVGDTNAFFPAKGQTSPLRHLCFDCPVQYECLNDSLAVGDEYGVWGGTRVRTRRALANPNPIPREPGSIAMTLTSQQIRAGLKHSLDGRTIAWIAVALDADEQIVSDAMCEHGWPDEMAMRQEIVRLSLADVTSSFSALSYTPEERAVRHAAGLDRLTTPARKPAPAAPRPDLSYARAKPTPPPVPRVVTPTPTAPETTMSTVIATDPKNVAAALAQLLASSNFTVRTKAEQIVTQITRLTVDQQKIANKERIAELKAEIARLEGKPAKAPTATAGAPVATFPCPDCGFSSVAPQGLGAHRAKAHGYRSPKVA